MIAWKIKAYQQDNAGLTSSLKEQNKLLFISNAAVQLRRMQDFMKRERFQGCVNETQRLGVVSKWC